MFEKSVLCLFVFFFFKSYLQHHNGKAVNLELCVALTAKTCSEMKVADHLFLYDFLFIDFFCLSCLFFPLCLYPFLSQTWASHHEISVNMSVCFS